MSFRHTHITQALYVDREDPKDVRDFINGLQSNFDEVVPQWSPFGRLRWIVLYGRDSDNFGEEYEMPERIKNLEGQLQGDVEIVSAWEAENSDKPRQRVWTIKGRGQRTIEEYLAEIKQ